MTFDEEGHLHVTPREVYQLAVEDPQRLIHEVLIPGTPWAFPTHGSYCRFLQHFADALNVHPRNILLKGSTKIGFSVAPRPNKLWRMFADSSDLDLAIIDQNYYERIDEEVRTWERHPNNRAATIRDERQKREFLNRAKQRGMFRCLRYFDLPLVKIVEHHNRCIDDAPIRECCGTERTLSAFVFRDWWGITDRYLYDMEELTRKMGNPNMGMPTAGDEPLTR